MRKKALLSIIVILCIIFGTNRVQATETWSNKQIIEDGIYEIETKIDSNMVIDISEASTKDGANVQIWERSNVYQQRFQLTYLGDGYYTIKSVKSGKMLDVEYASKENGTNVWQYESNSTDAQKWEISKSDDGFYVLKSKCNELVLTIHNSSKNNGTNIEVNEDKNLENQKFNFKKITTIKGTQTIEDGLYTIATVLDKNMVLDISEASTKSGANVQIWDNVDVPQQQFILKYDDGYYTIQNLKSQMFLDVTYGEIVKGTNVWQYEGNSTDAQKWVIEKAEDGYYNIISKISGIYLDVQDEKTSNGTNIQINLNTGKDNQKFLFNKVDKEKIIPNGTYEIVSKLQSNMILDISEGSKKDGANVQIWADANVEQQKFEFIHIGNGFYKIISKNSGKVLAVSTTDNGSFANVYQDTYREEDNQLWKIEKCEDDFYYIISKYNGKYLDVRFGETNNGTNIWTYDANFTNSQKFKLEQRTYGIDVSHWQDVIDFKTLSDAKKIDFMIIRAGQGTTIKDRQFERNYLEAKKYNIPIGTYLYSTAQSIEQAKNEANYLVNLLKGKSFELPVFYDIEQHEDLDNNTIAQMYIEFNNILKKSGHKTGLYASKFYLMYKINLSKLPKDTVIWMASYGKDTGGVPNDVYKFDGRFNIWQYTSKGIIPGIKGYVDCNIIY